MPYRSFTLAFFFIALLPFVKAQDPFIKKIDKDETTLGYQIVNYGNRLFILTGKVCNNISECATVIEIDEDGNVLWDKELPFLDVSSRSMVIENDTIFLSGNYNKTQQKFLFHQMSVEGGDSLATYDIVKPDDIYTNMFNLGMLKKEDKFYIYGAGEKNNGTIESSLIYVVDNQGNLDTLLSIFPMDHTSAMWQMRVDNQGNLMAFMILDSLDFGQVPSYRKIVKLNQEYDIIWEYTSDYVLNNYATPKSVVLEDDRIVYVTGNGNNNLNQNSLNAINLDSTISWQHFTPNEGFNHRVIYRIKKSMDGNIFGFGEWGNLIYDPRIKSTPWIFKISAEGEMIWERAYFELDLDGDNAKSGEFFDAVELDDGSIIAVGGMRSDNNDILIARFDSEGCLMFDCELLYDVTDVLSDVQNVALNTGITIYPNPCGVNEDLNIHLEYDLRPKEEFTIEIVNPLGEAIHTQSMIYNYTSIPLNSEAGLFIVVVKHRDKIIYSDKLIRI